MTGMVLVTGGAGYIGSHTCVALVEAGYDVTIVDNLDNSSIAAVERVRELTGGGIDFHEVDLLDGPALAEVFASSEPSAVVHFAGLKAVGESVEQPLKYYRTNVAGTVSLLGAMEEFGVERLVFSSSCTVYGQPEVMPITEGSALGAISPYGRTKLYVEEFLRDVAAARPSSRFALLRYFNPVGAHPSGRIGEDPQGIPNNLMPFAMQVAVGIRDELAVFGDDYDTPDGTCIRDYIHVMDLADAHVRALRALDDRIEGCTAINVGTGTGSSVLEVVAAVSDAIGRPLPHRIAPRRPGDAARVWADTSMASEVLDWRATRTLADMCTDHYRWQTANPSGYDE